MQTKDKLDSSTQCYLAAVKQANAEAQRQEEEAQTKHEHTWDCAGGRFSLEICHAYCEIGLNGTQFLSVAEQRSLWQSGTERERRFGFQISSWQGWERDCARQLHEWQALVEARLLARNQTCLTSDRAFSARIRQIRRMYFEKTLQARQVFFATTCSATLASRQAAVAYIQSAQAAADEFEAAMTQALDTWVCARLKAVRQLYEHERLNYLDQGLAGGEEITAYCAEFRRHLAFADKVAQTSLSSAADRQAAKIENARQCLNLAMGEDLIPVPKAARDDQDTDSREES